MKKHEKLKKLAAIVDKENTNHTKIVDGAGNTLYPENEIANAICDDGTWSGKMADEQADGVKIDVAALKNKFVDLHTTLDNQAKSAEADDK